MADSQVLDSSLSVVHREAGLALYGLSALGHVERFILSTPETRAIANDPHVFGLDYTRRLRAAMVKLFRAFKAAGAELGDEAHSMVFHILRGGMNFGLREALGEAYDWNAHRSAYISSQRAFDEKEGWHITENRYQKVPVFEDMDLFFADVVATGASLSHALLKLVDLAREGGSIRRLTFITIGGDRAEQLLAEADARCRELFTGYQGARMIYVEGVFGVAEANSPLQIALAGTDLLRAPAILAPEFLESQKEAPLFALERCTIYDAGSRAFDVPEYLDDVRDYWTQVLALAESGLSYADYFSERLPVLPCPDAWRTLNLAELVRAHLKSLDLRIPRL